MANPISSENNFEVNEMFYELDRLQYGLIAGILKAKIKEDMRAWEVQTQFGRHVRAPSSREQINRIVDSPEQAKEQNIAGSTNRYPI